MTKTEVQEEVIQEEKSEGKPKWVKMKSEDLEKLIVDLARGGESPAKIGLILRDKYAVPKSKLFGKKIKQVLDENDVKYQKETDIMKNRIESLNKHISKNKKDHPASRSLTKKLWALRRLEAI